MSCFNILVRSLYNENIHIQFNEPILYTISTLNIVRWDGGDLPSDHDFIKNWFVMPKSKKGGLKVTMLKFQVV